MHQNEIRPGFETYLLAEPSKKQTQSFLGGFLVFPPSAMIGPAIGAGFSRRTGSGFDQRPLG
jgi:hypothetical protein